MYQVLGEITFECEREVHLPPRLRALLVLLFVSPEHIARHEDVARCLGWGPQKDTQSFRKLVSDLRDKELPGIEIIPRNAKNQCKADVDRSLVDYLRFEEAARKAAAAGQPPEERLATLRRAMGEWSGEPLQGLWNYDFAVERERLTNVWRRARFDLAQCEFESGNLLLALEEATDALHRWPGDETFSALRADVQYALGEGADSTAGHGVSNRDSGRQRTHSHTEARQRTARQHSNIVPWQVPAGRVRLIGRDAEFNAIGRVLDPGGVDGPRVAVLSGMPGVGKTQLAIAWAHRNRERYEGALYVNLRGYAANEAEPADSTLARFLAELEVKPSAGTPEAMVAAYRSALASRSMLVILDNARDSEQARPLLPGPGLSAAIVTSRDRLDGLAVRENAWQLMLEPLSPDESLALLKSGLGAERVVAEPMYADELVRHCAGLPLAVNVLAAYARSRPKLMLWDLAKRVRDERARLDALGHGDADIDVRVVFGHSYTQLSAVARSLLHRIAHFPGSTISRHAIGAFSDLDAGSAHRAIEELRTANLLEEPEYERFSMHDLMRIFAVEMAEENESDRVGEILDEAYGYLLHSAAACDREIVRGRVLPIDDAVVPTAFRPDSAREALAWFDAEYPAILAAIVRANTAENSHYAWLLPLVTVTYQWRHRLYRDSRNSLEIARTAVERIGSPADQAAVYRLLAGAHRNLGEFSLASSRLQTALMRSDGAGDAFGSALASNNLGVVCRESSRAEEAVVYFTRALAEFRSLGDVLGKAGALAGLGAVHFDECRHGQALELCSEALDLFELMDEQSGVGDTRRMIGRIRAAQGDDAGAIENLIAARECYQGMGYPPREAEVLVETADLMTRNGRVAEARSALEHARGIFVGLAESDAAVDDIDDRLRHLDALVITRAEER